MKLTVNKYLNARTGAATVEAANPYYKNPGDVLDIIEAEVGQEYEGSTIWYKADDGQFYWSGGFEEIDFELQQAIGFYQLTKQNQLLLIKESVSYFFSIFKRKISGFYGLSFSYKNYDPNNIPCLIFQVESKNSNPTFFIPPVLKYKGFRLVTDVVQAQAPKAHGMGESISSEPNISGTVGFYCRDALGQYYIVTNYHVVAKKFIITGKYSYDYERDPEVRISIPCFGNNTSGRLMYGCLDYYIDYAIVKVNLQGSNSIGAYLFSGMASLDEIEKNFRPNNFVGVIYGAVSKLKSNTIKALNQFAPIDYYGMLKHELYGLIQLENMSTDGDSGAALTRNGQVIGLIVAGSADSTYAIPITRVIEEIKSKLGNINI
jgi:hypothetical protein